jgi:hypothetical protein
MRVSTESGNLRVTTTKGFLLLDILSRLIPAFDRRAPFSPL